MFNKALKTGVEKGDFTQPKGISPSIHLLGEASAFALP
jgi:linker histone H1 and H5 family